MEPKYSKNNLIAFLGKAMSFDTVYMWGTFGNKLTEGLIELKKNQYPLRYDEKRLAILRKKLGYGYYACDCCGLIKWFLMTEGGRQDAPVYQEKYDKTASEFYHLGTESGTIDTIPNESCLGLWKKGHMGISFGDGMCIECTLSKRGDGVRRSKISEAGFTHWFRFPYIIYENENQVIPNDEKVPEVPCGDDPPVAAVSSVEEVPDEKSYDVVTEHEETPVKKKVTPLLTKPYLPVPIIKAKKVDWKTVLSKLIRRK